MDHRPVTTPVFVASKNRPGGGTFSLLEESGIDFTVVVEPQDRKRYRKFASRLELPENDRGLPYVRQFILEHARRKRLGWYWMLDDDLTSFYRATGHGKCRPASARECLGTVEDLFFAVEGLAQVGLEYQQFAWSQRSPAAWGSYCDVAVAINTPLTKGVNNRAQTDLKVDRDFTMQLLARGLLTARARRWAFAAPKNGSNPGGCSDHYAEDGREVRSSKAMCEIWGPQICKLVRKPDGRPDVDIKWGFFKPPKGVLN